MVLWDVMVGDWKAGNTPKKLADKILKKAYSDAIICLHDGCEKYGGAKGAPFHTINALKIVIPKLKDEGYLFVTVEDFFKNE
jgi:peptidoglycan/xylan/chitin deacetylase (PgdA/CDA1 family)